jgi:hypothetical protein
LLYLAGLVWHLDNELTVELARVRGEPLPESF